MTTYSLTCINNSQLNSSFAVFQKPPRMTVPETVYALAWFARPVPPSSRVTFTWTLDYAFVWAETGILQPGVNFAAVQTLAADPYGANLVQLTAGSESALAFANQSATGETGKLTVQQSGDVPSNAAAVGIGMSGSGIFAIQTAPNITAVFPPQPNYWVIFGNYQTGDVMDLENIAGAVEASYGGGALTSRTATLGPDNLITMTD